jgi:hypothetical protein
VILSEAHLRRVLAAYATYYNELRTHRSLAKDTLFIEQSSVSALSHHDRSLAAFTTNTAESNIRYAQVLPRQDGRLRRAVNRQKRALGNETGFIPAFRRHSL